MSGGTDADPIAAAARAIDAILAAAHEAGQVEAVRILHAVGALLATAPVTRPPKDGAIHPAIRNDNGERTP